MVSLILLVISMWIDTTDNTEKESNMEDRNSSFIIKPKFIIYHSILWMNSHTGFHCTKLSERCTVTKQPTQTPTCEINNISPNLPLFLFWESKKILYVLLCCLESFTERNQSERGWTSRWRLTCYILRCQGSLETIVFFHGHRYLAIKSYHLPLPTRASWFLCSPYTNITWFWGKQRCGFCTWKVFLWCICNSWSAGKGPSEPITKTINNIIISNK